MEGQHQEHAPICSDLKNIGQRGSPEKDECTKVPLFMFSKFLLQIVLKMYTSVTERSQPNGVDFSRSRTYQLSCLMANLCQSEMRVK